MAEVIFKLIRRKNQTGNLPIKLDYSFGNQRLEYYTGINVHPDKWDDGLDRDQNGELRAKKRLHHGRAKQNTERWTEINEKLKGLDNKITTLRQTAEVLNIPITVEYFRDGLKEYQGKDKPKQADLSVLEGFNAFIDSKRSKDAVNTIKKYTSTLNHLTGFCEYRKTKDKKRSPTKFDEISLSFLEDFRSYLIEVVGLTHNTQVKYCKTVKAYLKWAELQGYCKNLEFRKFMIEGEKEPAIIFLTWPELMTLYDLDVKNQALEQVRDVFCFGCFTGQRYSDVAALRKHHISNDIWVNTPIKSHKAAPLYIPLNNYAKAILKKYNFPGDWVLPVISNQKMNEQLKALGKLAGLNTPVTVYRFKGKKRIENTHPKYEVLTTHVMRKTFVSNALSLGMQTAMIKEFTGHKNEKDFNRYLAVITEDKKKAMELFNR